MTGLPRSRYIVQDFAWGDSGDAIVAGQTSSNQTAQAPAASSALGFLALGAPGLQASRAQRVAALSPND